MVNIHKIKYTGTPYDDVDSIYTFKVYYNIIQMTDGTGNVNDEVINKQVDILNEGFSGMESIYSRCKGVPTSGIDISDTKF